MVAKVVTRDERLMAKFQVLTPERQQQLLDFADFLVQQQLTNVEQRSKDSAIDSTSDSKAENWVDQISGSFKDDPEFEEILRYGREFRQTDAPSPDVLDNLQSNE
jgi:hypothetical protein